MAPIATNSPKSLGDEAHPEETTSGGGALLILSASQGQSSDARTILIKAASAELNEIAGMGRLKKPLRIQVEKEEGGYLIHAADLDITEAGTTFEEALEGFYAFLREDADHWKTAEDSMLSEEAKALKLRYLEYIP